jgi:hypothetical protein
MGRKDRRESGSNGRHGKEEKEKRFWKCSYKWALIRVR